MGLLDIIFSRKKKEQEAEEEAKRQIAEEERLRLIEEEKHKDEILTYVDQIKVGDTTVDYAIFSLDEKVKKEETFLIQANEELNLQDKMDNITSQDETWTTFLKQFIGSLSQGNKAMLLPPVGIFETPTYLQIVIFNKSYEKTGLDIHKGKIIVDHFVKAKIVNYEQVKVSYLI